MNFLGVILTIVVTVVSSARAPALSHAPVQDVTAYDSAVLRDIMQKYLVMSDKENRGVKIEQVQKIIYSKNKFGDTLAFISVVYVQQSKMNKAFGIFAICRRWNYISILLQERDEGAKSRDAFIKRDQTFLPYEQSNCDQSNQSNLSD